MAGTGKKWLIGCGAGCGGLVLLVILISVGGSLWMMRPLNDAVDAQKALNETYGPRDAFVPPAEGIAPARMEAFLTVRDSLMGRCEPFREVARSLDRMDAVDDDEGASAGQALLAVGGLMGSISGVVAETGKFIQTRNEVLLEQEMSLGEYVWIYVLAYHSWLDYEPGTTFDEDGRAELSRMERRVIRRLMVNHAEELRAAGLADRAAVWEAEVESLERSEREVPFAGGGLPAEVVAALEPYRDRLAARYCPETAGIEFSTIRKKGLSIQAN